MTPPHRTPLQNTGRWIHLLLLKARFAMAGLAATTVDYTLYLVLVGHLLSPVGANVVSYSCGALTNFTLHRRFVFQLRGGVYRALSLSLLVSVGGLLLSTGLIYSLSQVAFFAMRQYITKALVTGIVFFYNFYLKRLVFEGKML